MTSAALTAREVIRAKRDGGALAPAQIEAFVGGLVDGGWGDAQVAALAMAILLRGMDRAETLALTCAMRDSGSVLSWPDAGRPVLDKHSSGGVGDKVSLMLAPILAACGAWVPMVSGRGLGHTGGTLDKLETIPGFNTQLNLTQLADTLRKCGAALIGQTPRIVPADRILYALRDHTGTVESPYLITASIMSKKLAESLNALVLDVKTGSGAFMPTYERSKFLAELMVQTGEAAGTRTVAVLT
ncbi:MAG: thymidine phosphorylase, partial [Burkholderiales bacterium]|nr:thymidine phosphorylase [Burkholderiales bacterium]